MNNSGKVFKKKQKLKYFFIQHTC